MVTLAGECALDGTKTNPGTQSPQKRRIAAHDHFCHADSQVAEKLTN
jgi:hypothetical protein